MRVLWHSCAPWLGTGYGTQTALWTRYLAGAGHQVAISSYYSGREPARDQWEGITVFPPPAPVENLPAHACLAATVQAWQPDVVVVLADIWVMDFTAVGDVPVLAWMPIDCEPLSIGDARALYTSDVIPVAMSEHGVAMLERAGVPSPAYVPHAIDTSVWVPDMDRAGLRLAFGIPAGYLAIGANYNNIDPVRKATPELFRAFAEFHARHPASVLFAHTLAEQDKSLDQRVLAKTLGITDHVRFADQDRVHYGGYSTLDMIHWYNAMDVIANATYGEGFGLPALEAQACGTPVILSDGTTGRQLRGPGWLVQTEPWWNLTHAAWWHRPSIHGLKKALTAAAGDRMLFKRAACRQFALRYDIQVVGPMWLDLLNRVGGGFLPPAPGKLLEAAR